MVLSDTLRRYLDITWQDEHTEKKLDDILARAKAMLSQYAGTKLRFEDETPEQQLLLDLCRYIWNNASEDFETNYLSNLLMLRVTHQVEAMNREAAQDSESKNSSGTG